MQRETIEDIAATTISLIAAITIFLAAPLVETLSIEWKILAIIITTPGLYVVFYAVRWVLDRIRYAPLAGAWFYMTLPDPDEETGEASEAMLKVGVDRIGFGYMRFFPSGADWDYEVLLFPDAASLMKYAKEKLDDGRSHGFATSDAFRYDQKRKRINILYHAEYHKQGQPDRYGRLNLNVVNSKRLRGRWTSDVNKTTLASGEMVACRLDEFPALYEQLSGDSLDV